MNDFFQDELKVGYHIYKIDKVEYDGVFERQAMVVKLKEESMVRKTFATGVKSKNDGIKIENVWPSFTYNRRRVLFDWAKDARRLNGGVSFQVSVGLTDFA